MEKVFKNLFSRLAIIGFSACIVLLSINACKKIAYVENIPTGINILGYLQNDPTHFSLLTQIITRSGSAGYLAAYGQPGYTLFAPTNDAVTAWLKAMGQTSVDNVSVADLKNMLNFSLILDTLTTKNFKDGKLPTLTAYGQYLTTGAVSVGGVTSYIINKQGSVTQSNIRCSNGIIHVVDHVLTFQTLSLAQLIAANPRYTIFTQALKETGFYDSLNVVQPSSTTLSYNDRFRTVVAESDSAIHAAGYSSYGALKAALSKIPGNAGGDPHNHADSLWLYAAYHVSPNANYLGDIVLASSLQTSAPNEVINTQLSGSTIYFNHIVFNNILEPGVQILRQQSDVTAANGVVHESQSFFRIKARQPTATFFDVANVIGINSSTAYGRGFLGVNINNAASVTPDMIFQNYNGQGAAYIYPSAGGTYCNLNDYLGIALTDPPNNNGLRTRWLDVRTPLLVKGQYKVWVCVLNVNGGQVQVSMNPGTPLEQVLPTLVASNQPITQSGVALIDPNADNLMEAQGFKRYMATTADTAVNKAGVRVAGDVPVTYDKGFGRLVGVANITNTSRQWIRFTGIKINGNSSFCIDMVHFIPVGQNQQYPRFSLSGLQFNAH